MITLVLTTYQLFSQDKSLPSTSVLSLSTRSAVWYPASVTFELFHA